MIRHTIALLALLLLTVHCAADEFAPGLDAIYRIQQGRTRMVNALWGENPKEMQFGEGRSRVVIADLKGPGVITMIHFALPQAMRLNRDTVLRIYWDGERQPSVEAPLVDFFCDPNGALERVDAAVINKKRGWNCYLPMPFARSARVEVSTDNARYPNGSWMMNPCYSYVMYRPLRSLPADAGYLHAQWRQQALLLGKEDYRVFEAAGPGQFVGWNMTIRGVGASGGYPVDENEKFYLDGETEPSIEWQGLEDSFGFSWGFPEQANSFPYTGYQPYYQSGAAAYRLCLSDRISFRKSLRMTVGFGKHEAAFFFQEFSKPENMLQLSSVAYWYQKEPHRPFPPLPPAGDRAPANLAKPSQANRDQGEVLSLRCGSPDGDVEFLADGWDFVFRNGYSFNGSPWTSEIKHCWADYESLEFDLTCPKGSAGTLRLFILDGDNFLGGRKESITVAGKPVGEYDSFQAGKWVEVPISADQTADGHISVQAKPTKAGSNAVVTFVRFRLPK